MQRLLFKFKNSLICELCHRQSFSLSGLKKELAIENIIRENVNSSYNVTDYSLDNILHNTEITSIAPYEHYFAHSEHTEPKTVTDIGRKVSVANAFVKTKSFAILDGIQVLKNHRTLPRKCQEVISIIERKMQIIYPDYVSVPKVDVSTSTAYKFVCDVIANTKMNAAYIDVCLQIGFLDKAFQFMSKIRMENRKTVCVTHKSMIVDSVFYEPTIYFLARKGNVKAIMSLVDEMESMRILPSLSVIFACLDAAGKQEVCDTGLIQRMMSYLPKHDISLHKAFTTTPISHDNYPNIIKAIKTVIPEFKFERANSLNKTASVSLKNTPLNATIKELHKLFDHQLEVEKKGSFIADSTVFRDTYENTTKTTEIETEWRNNLRFALKSKQNMLVGSDRWRMYPFLAALPDLTVVDVMIDILHRCMNDKTIQFTHINNLYNMIGDCLENHYRHRCLKKDRSLSQLKLIYGSFLAELEQRPNDVSVHEMWHRAVVDNIAAGNGQTRSVPWDRKLKSSIGRVIYEIMFENLNVTFRDSNGVETRTPVLYEEFIEGPEGGFTAVRIQSKVASMFKGVNKVSLNFSALELPMLHPPIPVDSNYKTGYFHVANYATRLIRRSPGVELYDDDITQPGDVTRIYNALNVLSMCSWRIDTDNLDLITNIFSTKGSLKLKIPIRVEEMEAPKRPKDLSQYRCYSEYRKAFTAHHKDKKEMYSLWVTLFYKINIAQRFRDKQFWFPYSMDFRSRVYPCPPHLNHIGDDTTRGLLKFSTGKKLGRNGLDWLKIHLINIYGMHKRSSNEDRLKAANDSIPEIMDSVLNPLGGRRWWQESEKPWQTLSACREIFLAMRFSDEQGHGLADDFISHLGVHQDGSCNGLQHYAALGRDAEGARAVNLINMETPQDVYSDVLKYVKLKIKSDSEKGVTEARDLDGLVTRKVIKQTVMTTVYGVTQIGAKEQVQKQLKELEALPREKLVACSIYLSKLVLSSIGEIFSSARKIQNWFVELASSIAKCRGANISWRTPLNLVVTQPYFEDTHLRGLKADTRRNKNGFPPNFIHSLDSTHMMMTALKCWQQNVTFVSVHDCYWTHACDVDAMNKICREQFVELYKTPILENLSEFLYEKYGFHQGDNHTLTETQLKFNKLCRNIPQKGSYNIEEVLRSTYFFS